MLLFIAIPNYKSEVAAYTALSLVALEKTLPPGVQTMHCLLPNNADVGDVRNILVAEALAAKADAILFIDDDISFDVDTVWRMLDRLITYPVQCTIAQKRNATWDSPVEMSVPLNWLQIDKDELIAKTILPAASFGLGMIDTRIFSKTFSDTANYISLQATDLANHYLQRWFEFQIVEAEQYTMPYERAKLLGIETAAYRRGEDYVFAEKCWDADILIIFDLQAKLVHWQGSIAHDVNMMDILRQQGIIE